MHLPIAREGWPFILPPALLGAALCLPGGSFLWIGIPLILLGLGILLFFRDPHRDIPPGDDTLVSPADGRVVRAGPVEPGPDVPEGATQVLSIFLSLTNVHINRAPSAGTIGTPIYRPGQFLAAYNPAASERNERNEIPMDTPRGTITLRQIAGVVARRIVFRKREGDTVSKGERLGLIRFGSRTDLFLGPEWEWTVAVGQQIRGGSTIVAERATMNKEGTDR